MSEGGREESTVSGGLEGPTESRVTRRPQEGWGLSPCRSRPRWTNYDRTGPRDGFGGR